MIKEQHFKISISDFQRMNTVELEQFCGNLLPGMAFRFATFENHDHRDGIVTCYLYSYVPDKVYFTVETALDIEDALAKLRDLNPGVHWDRANLNYFDHDLSGHARVTIELSLSIIPMRVGAGGVLIYKSPM